MMSRSCASVCCVPTSLYSSKAMESSVRQPQIAAVSVIECLATLLLIKCALRLGGFARTYRSIRRAAERRTKIDDDVSIAVRSVGRRVAAAAALFPGRALCLEQSLCLSYCLARRGVHVDLRLGVQPYGFVAHAWVEYRGQAINEDREVLRKIVAFPSVGL